MDILLWVEKPAEYYAERSVRLSYTYNGIRHPATSLRCFQKRRMTYLQYTIIRPLLACPTHYSVNHSCPCSDQPVYLHPSLGLSFRSSFIHIFLFSSTAFMQYSHQLLPSTAFIHQYLAIGSVRTTVYYDKEETTHGTIRP